MLKNEELLKLAYTKMYFGKYKDWYLSDIPEPYFVWFNQKGFPPGKTGEQMRAVFELKINGLEYLLKEIRKKYPHPNKI
ncbi:hypothetical protein SAMN04488096_104260 [Mesonia phycicola]|uniref:DUF3820 family protein n=1 Tax=Mesonia phycicola TaxID=579105 RepID=A0A1M6DZH5_9FLAO|nr:DUF3820 family protein [Mesonia phycicola]SHI78549.1 hypothetical protein SAMN04488096_104260 [Mesonia phycicola]